MATKAAQQPRGSLLSTVVFGAVLVVGAGVYFRFPGLLIAWLALTIALFAEPYPMLTGPKDAAGRPAPNGPSEDREVKRKALASAAEWPMVLPTTAWLPGWWPKASWVAGLAAAVIAYHLPVDGVPTDIVPIPPEVSTWFPLAQAVVTAVMVWALSHGRRSQVRTDPYSGTRLDSLAVAGPLAWVPAVLGAVAAGWACYQFLGLPWSATLAGSVLGALGGAYPMWSKVAKDRWRTVKDARDEWEARWRTALGMKPGEEGPVIVDRKQVGQILVDTFETRGGRFNAGELLSRNDKLAPAMGSWDATIAPVTDVDSQGNQIPGSEHPTRVQVIMHAKDAGAAPSIADPSCTAEEAELMVTKALAAAASAAGMPRVAILSFDPLHSEPVQETRPSLLSIIKSWRPKPRAPRPKAERPEISGWSPSAIIARFAYLAFPTQSDTGGEGDGDITPDQLAEARPEPPPEAGPKAWVAQVTDAATVRQGLAGAIGGLLDVEVVAEDRAGSVYLGLLSGGQTDFADPAVGQHIADVAEVQEWQGRWSALAKVGANPPLPRIEARVTATVGRCELVSFPHTIRQGLDPAMYYNKAMEAGISTAMAGAPLVSFQYFQRPDSPAGTRHDVAFRVVYSTSAPPASPDLVQATKSTVMRTGRTVNSTGEHWLLAAYVNTAFDNAKLARPEVTRVQALSAVGSRRHLWKVEVMLYGEVTLTELWKKLGVMQRSLGVPYLRITSGDSPGTAVMVMGGDLSSGDVTLHKESTSLELADLDWQWAFHTTGLYSASGQMPSQTHSESLELNPDVKRLTFELPPGVSVGQMKDKLEKLKSATGNFFVQIEPSTSATEVTMMTCFRDPMPQRAEFDLALSTGPSKAIPFATSVTGEPIYWDWHTDPHLVVIGKTGSGKSITMLALMFGALVRGAEVYLADKSKGGADFVDIEPWLSGVARTIPETLTMLEHIYAEVKRRKDLNTKHGAKSYVDLPPEMRPAHIVAALDEFTSLLITEVVEKLRSGATEEEVMEHARASAEATTIAKCGILVGRIGREARSAGVSVILGAQRLTAKILENIPGSQDLRTNMSRILQGNASIGERASALAHPFEAPDLGEVVPAGRGIYEPGTTRSILMQAWYSDDVTDQMSGYLSANLAPAQKIDLDEPSSRREVRFEGQVLEGQAITEDDQAEDEIEGVEFDEDDFAAAFADLGIGPLDDHADDEALGAPADDDDEDDWADDEDDESESARPEDPSPEPEAPAETDDEDWSAPARTYQLADLLG